MIEKEKYNFKYDQNNNLCEYTERDDFGNLRYLYEYENGTLKKVYRNYEKNCTYKEFKSITTYPINSIMTHELINGRSRVVVKASNGDCAKPIQKIERVDGNYVGYSIKTELLNQWQESIKRK